MTEIREWINTGIAFLGLIVLIIGTWQGVSKLQEINVNLNQVTSDKIITHGVDLIDENGSVYGNISQTGIFLKKGRRLDIEGTASFY